MEILQWLFKTAHEQERESRPSSPPTKREAVSDKNVKGKDIGILQHHKAYQRTKRSIKGSKHGCNKLKLFAFICGKNIPKDCIYSTINLNRLGNLNIRRHFVHSVKMKREKLSQRVGITKQADSAAHIGKKVLPITEASFSTSTETNDQCCTTETTDHAKGDKKKPISRMKELHRWAVAAKPEKRGKFKGQKVIQFQRRGTIKAVPDDDQLSSESPKISFTLDAESCSITSSIYSTISISSLSHENDQAQIVHSPIYIPTQEIDRITCRKGNWITTDSEFVVLEL